MPYQQVYSWTKKYDTDSVHGFEDRLERTKSEEELTKEEKLKCRIQQLLCRLSYPEIQQQWARLPNNATVYRENLYRSKPDEQ